MLVYGKIKDMGIVPNSQREWLDFLEINENKDVQIKRTTYVRTEAQNNAIHKYFEMVSTSLTEKGLTFDLKIGGKIVKLDWTPNLVKEAMWKPIMKALVGKSSTTQMDKVEDINKIYDHINKFLSENFQLHVPFPHEEKEKEIVLKTNDDHLLNNQIL